VLRQRAAPVIAAVVIRPLDAGCNVEAGHVLEGTAHILGVEAGFRGDVDVFWDVVVLNSRTLTSRMGRSRVHQVSSICAFGDPE
jgi:hypothetical protein